MFHFIAPAAIHLRNCVFMRLAPLVLAAVPACFPQSAGAPASAVSLGSPAGELPAHETLFYNVEWRLINAGRAKVEFHREPADGAQVKIHLESAGLVSTLYKVD